MNKLPITLLAAVARLTTPAGADDLIQPGQWKVTASNLMKPNFESFLEKIRDSKR